MIWTPQTKHNATLTPTSKNASTFSPSTVKSAQSATGGLYYGFGAFTYAGGEQIIVPPTWTPLTKS